MIVHSLIAIAIVLVVCWVLCLVEPNRADDEAWAEVTER